jgi:hypothetical protein
MRYNRLFGDITINIIYFGNIYITSLAYRITFNGYIYFLDLKHIETAVKY